MTLVTDIDKLLQADKPIRLIVTGSEYHSNVQSKIVLRSQIHPYLLKSLQEWIDKKQLYYQ